MRWPMTMVRLSIVRQIRFLLPTLALGLGAAAACSGPARPPPLGSGPLDDGGAADTSGQTPSLIPDGGGLPPLCQQGEDAGFCTCVDQPLLLNPPNVYFVLDRSGSMNESGKWTTVRQVLAEVVEKLGPRIDVGAAVFPDPTQDACAPGVEVLPMSPGDPAGTVGSTVLRIARALDIGANGGTPTAATLSSLVPHLQALAATRPTYVVLATDGGPNCDSGIMCTVDECQLNIESVNGCVPDTPPNCCDPSVGGPMNCNDGPATESAVASLAAAGIPVYVVGVPGSAPYADILNQMAIAGGTAQSGSVGDGGLVDGGTTAYYAVDSAGVDAFNAAISEIAAKITATCTLPLQSMPDPSMVNVFLDEKPVPPDPVNGWSIDGSTITLLGTTCQEVLTGQVIDVRVIAGCPTVIK
jgi:hypothetical protein